MQIKQTFNFLTGILLISLFSACNAGQPADDGWTTYQSDLGLQFEVPEDWSVEESDGVINLTTNVAALESGELDGEAGASITPATIDDFDGSNDTAIILDLFIDFFNSGTAELEQVAAPGPATIQGQSASTVSYRGTARDQAGFYTITVIAHQERLALILTIDGSSDESYTAALERITNSLQIGEPVTE